MSTIPFSVMWSGQMQAFEKEHGRPGPANTEREINMPATKTRSRAKAKKTMQIGDIRDKARLLGIVPGKMKKVDLIHSIQAAEGCAQCFGRSNGQCVYTDCCFMPDCLKTRL